MFKRREVSTGARVESVCVWGGDGKEQDVPDGHLLGAAEGHQVSTGHCPLWRGGLCVVGAAMNRVGALNIVSIPNKESVT